MNASADAARAAAARNPHWYHSIELVPGVLTPGLVDLRAVAPRVLPREMSGLRAVDVGTFDGFWAFEMERRGARVTAVDLPRAEAAEWPPVSRAVHEAAARDMGLELGLGFRIAAEVLGSSVERVEADVYDLSPALVGGAADVVFAGAILLHLRDPVRALERIHSTLRPGGRAVLLEPFSMRDTLLHRRRTLAQFQAALGGFTWWYPNLATLRAWAVAAGFHQVRRTGLHRPGTVTGLRQWLCGLTAVRPSGD